MHPQAISQMNATMTCVAPSQPPKSEHQIESQKVETSLACMAEVVNVLERRLYPLMTPSSAGKCVGDDGCVPVPILSQVGQQLRSYSNQIDSFNDRLQGLLRELALD